MQIIYKNNKPFKLIAEDSMMITKDRENYFKYVFIGCNDSIENYNEVGYEIWSNYVTDKLPTNEVEKLNNKIIELKDENTKQNTVIENMMLDILDLMWPEDLDEK